MASPFSTCWRRRVRVTRGTAGPAALGRQPRAASPGATLASAGRPLLLHVDELAVHAVRIHLHLGDVELLLVDLASRRRREGDLPERGVVGAGDDLLVELDAQLGQIHPRDRRLLVQRRQRLYEDLDAREGLSAELGRVLLLL